MNNLIKNPGELKKFKNKRFKFIVSSRNIRPDVSLIDYLKVNYVFIQLSQIQNVFGSVTINSRLYGGRMYEQSRSMTESHVKELYDKNIGISLNLTNHFFDMESYKSSLPLLEKFHSPKNSLIITNDELAKNIKKDFPGYTIKASIIKNINTISRLEKALELYDYVTLPMDLNDEDEFLGRIPQKDKVILFANANCAYTCPARTCYYGFSQYNRGEKMTSFCSKNKIDRLEQGPVFFNIEKLAEMGFTYFKLVPLFYKKAEVVTQKSSWSKKTSSPHHKNPDAYIVSYPKSGRTWLRFILANYFNLLYKLNLDVDLYNFFNILPNDSKDDVKGEHAYRYDNRPDMPLILFSHKEMSRLKEPHGKIVFLIRSPYDIMVSDFFQQTQHIKCYNGNIKQFIRDEKRGINRLCEFYNNWGEKLDNKNTFVLSYEELLQDTQDVAGKLLCYLDLSFEKKLLELSINNSDFERMQDIEKEKGFPSDNAYDINNNEALRMREGKQNRYNKYLDKEDVDYIKNMLHQKLNKNVMELFIKHKSLQ
nr:sulfotransferase domain-containing protein [uncultured Draconibacterium sp.]